MLDMGQHPRGVDAQKKFFSILPWGGEAGEKFLGYPPTIPPLILPKMGQKFQIFLKKTPGASMAGNFFLETSLGVTYGYPMGKKNF